MRKFFNFYVAAAFVAFSYGLGYNEVVETEHPSKINGTVKIRTEIRKSILADYDKFSYPDNATLSFGIAIIDFDVDEEKQTFEADIWLRMFWTDDRLKWDSSNVNVLRMGPNEIWIPDITLYNSKSSNHGDLMTNCGIPKPLIYPNGEVLVVAQCRISAFCNLTLNEHPFGEQSCGLKFASWTYDGDIMNVELYNGEANADMTGYMGNNKWDLTKNTATRQVKVYPCCSEPYPSLHYNLSFKRNVNRNVCDV